MGILQIPIHKTIDGKAEYFPLMYFRRKTLMDLTDFTLWNLLKSHQCNHNFPSWFNSISHSGKLQNH